MLNIISIYLFVTVLLIMFLSAYIQSRSGPSYTKLMALLGLAVSFYLYGYSGQLNAASTSQLLFWNRFQYIGIPFIAAIWLTIAMMYAGYFSPIKKSVMALIYIVPLITFVLRLTNDFHGLYYKSITFKYSGGHFFLIGERGPWMIVQTYHSMLMILIGIGVFVRFFFIRHSMGKKKIRVMMLAFVITILAIVIDDINPLEYNIDYVALFVPIVSFIVIYAIVRYDFLEVKVMARNLVFENSSNGMLLLNHNDEIVDYNISARYFFEHFGIHLRQATIENVIKGKEEALKNILINDTSSFELIYEGEDSYFEVTTDRLFNKDGDCCGRLKSIKNITKRQKLNNDLINRATIDELSGLLNRREFMYLGRQIFDESMKENKRLHLLMMDLDRFKLVNDTYGHMAGDQVISIFGKQLRNSFREEDIVGRLGGEEFAVLIEALDDEEAMNKANAFREKVASYDHRESDIDFHITVSIGIAKLSGGIMKLDDLMNRADQALYLSKDNGRDQVTFYKE